MLKFTQPRLFTTLCNSSLGARPIMAPMSIDIRAYYAPPFEQPAGQAVYIKHMLNQSGLNEQVMPDWYIFIFNNSPALNPMNQTWAYSRLYVKVD